MQSWLWACSHLDVYVEKPECSFIPAYSREPKEGVCKRGKEQSLIPSEGKQEEMMPPRVDSESWCLLGPLQGWCSLCITHLSQGCAQGHKQTLLIDGGTSITLWKKKNNIYISLNQTAMKWEQKHRREEEIKRDNEKRRRKPINHICTRQCCTQRMATHRLVESNRSLKTERWTN